MSEEYDVAVIGGGPGGYVCAIKSAQLGLKTVCIEGRGSLGGTCLNVGCIPSKALLHASQSFEHSQTHLAELGVNCGSVSVDISVMQKYKETQVRQLAQGIEFLFKKNKVKYVKGWGKIKSPGLVAVSQGTNKPTEIRAKNIVIATGSQPSSLPGVKVDEKRIVTSTGALALTKVPKKIAVIGAGVIGLELGSIWRRLGAEVVVVEYLERITPGLDNELSTQLQKQLGKQGMSFVLGASVQNVKALKNKLKLTYKKRQTDKEEVIEADIVLVATGREAFTKNLGAEDVGITMDQSGRVKVDSHWRTGVEGIFAIGDVVAGPMLAHKAEEEGVAVAELIAGRAGHVNYQAIPSVIYTDPEVASVGLSEEALKEQGSDYVVGKFPFIANARAKGHLDTDGFVKVLADKDTDRVLGVHIIGPLASEMVHEACVAMEFGASAEDIARTCHAHPTISEAVREAALAAGDGAIHI